MRERESEREQKRERERERETKTLPAIAVYPLGLAAGPIAATNVVSSRAVNFALGNASHSSHVRSTSTHSSNGSRPRWMGLSEAV